MGGTRLARIIIIPTINAKRTMIIQRREVLLLLTMILLLILLFIHIILHGIIMFTATRPQAATYLLGVCLFSISFLVFLNSSVSFVITDLIHQKEGVGNAVGTLGFADELVALIACPTWGVLSDRVGVRTVSVTQSLQLTIYS